MVPRQPAADPPHHVAVHGVTLALRLSQQQRVHKRPDLPVSAQALHTEARDVAEHVLHPLRLRDLVVAAVIHIRFPPGETQWKTSLETARGFHGCGLLGHTGPPELRHGEGLRELLGLRLNVVALGQRLHATARR